MTVQIKTPAGLDISTKPVCQTIVSEYFDVTLYTLGKLAWVRLSTYAKKDIPKGVDISVPLPVKPAENIFALYMNTIGATSVSTHLSANITKDKGLTITCYGMDYPQGKSLNLSHMFFIQ